MIKLWVSSYRPKCCLPIKLQGSLKCNLPRKKWMNFSSKSKVPRKNFTFGMQINIKVSLKLVLSFWLCIIRHVQSNPNQFAYFCSISGKVWAMKLIFYLKINTKIFYKLIVSLWVCMARHAQSTQNNSFIISLQYVKENVKDGVNFCLLIIVKSFFKVILPFLICVARHVQITQNKKSAISLQYLKTEVNDEVDFLHAGKHELTTNWYYDFAGDGQAFPKFPK